MELVKQSPLMRKMVHEDKHLGRKTGKGFFDVSPTVSATLRCV